MKVEIVLCLLLDMKMLCRFYVKCLFMGKAGRWYVIKNRQTIIILLIWNRVLVGVLSMAEKTTDLVGNKSGIFTPSENIPQPIFQKSCKIHLLHAVIR